jgi:hypothetical protein
MSSLSVRDRNGVAVPAAAPPGPRPARSGQCAPFSGLDNYRTVVEDPTFAPALLQTRELAALARHFGLAGEATVWTRQADDLRAAMLAQLWTGDRFTARSPTSGTTWNTGSLLFLMPIVLGADLPTGVRDTLAERIRAHLTDHGLATELRDRAYTWTASAYLLLVATHVERRQR